MSKNRPLTLGNIEPDPNITPVVAGIEPKTVKMVRPFAEAEARERERVIAKQEAKTTAEQKNVTATGSTKTNLQSSPPDKPDIIPDQLNITIRTSIPGYQKIEYKPSMTIKDSDSTIDYSGVDAVLLYGGSWTRNQEIAEAMNDGKPPQQIEYRMDGKFYRIIKRRWHEAQHEAA
jgi:hypothetical protein